ncbi:MAG: type II secretion system F family protein [Planctomycetaceae bacterium]|jgi:tight adherence protein B|nr:type II secretion system F family protein [Planctomycetaceae bacterium]
MLTSVFVGIAAGTGLLLILPIWEWLAQRLLQADLKRLVDLDITHHSWAQVIRLTGFLLVFALVVGWLTQTLILAIAFCVIVLLVLPVTLHAYLLRQQAKIRGQLVEACVAIANSCRAGLSLPDAFQVASGEVAEPFRLSLQRVHTEYTHGRNMEEVILDVRNRLRLDEFNLFASAVLTCWDRGGNLSKTLERIALSLQEHHRLEKKIESDTAEGKRVVKVLAIFPVIFLLGFVFLYPSGTLLYFTSIGGQIMLILIAAVIFGAIVWSDKIVAIDA